MNAKVKVKEVDIGELLNELLGGERASSDEDVLKDIVGAIAAKAGGNGSEFPTLVEAQADALRYMGEPIPMVSSFVELNEWGKVHYRLPRTDKNEVAIVLEVWPQYQMTAKGDMVNGVIAVHNRKGFVRTIPVDLRKYKVVEVKAV